MFSGLVDQTSPVCSARSVDGGLKLILKRPLSYMNLKLGESFSINGLCLTLEDFDKSTMSFLLGPETLKITAWTVDKIQNKHVNIERSLSFQSLLGGHLLTGHVDGLARVCKLKKEGQSLWIQLQIPLEFKDFFWTKAYIGLNGVSLTVNAVKEDFIDLCIIPKSLQITNLSDIEKGDLLNFEVDYLSRPLIHAFKSFINK